MQESTSEHQKRDIRELLFYIEREGRNTYLFPRVLRFAALLYILVIAWSTWYIVDKDENAVVQRLGKHVRTEGPGPAFKMPWPFETATLVPVKKAENMEIGFRTIDDGPPAKYEDVPDEALMLTGDANIVDLDFIVQYRPANAADWLFKVNDPKIALWLLTQSSMRFTVGHSAFDEVATFGRSQIQAQTQNELIELCKQLSFGPTVAGIQLQDVHPPLQVMDAFKDVTNAKEEKERMIRSAEGYRNDVIPRARGQAKKLVEDALGYQATRVQAARGDSARFVSILQEYKRQPEITRTRLQLETLAEVMPGTKQWIILPDAGPLQLMNLTQGGK